MTISLKNVLGGWQLLIEDSLSGRVYLLGPVHGSTTAAWQWQKNNLRDTAL